MLREPGGLKERVVHAWTFDGREIARGEPRQLPCDGDDVAVVRTIVEELEAGATECVHLVVVAARGAGDDAVDDEGRRDRGHGAPEQQRAGRHRREALHRAR